MKAATYFQRVQKKKIAYTAGWGIQTNEAKY